MKHIRSYSEQDLKDILLEVNDVGFSTIMGEYSTDINCILIRASEGVYSPPSINDWIYQIGKKDNQIIIKTKREEKINNINNIVKDCLLRLKDYLGDRYIKCKIYYFDKSTSYYKSELIKLKEDMILNEAIVGIEFYYYK